MARYRLGTDETRQLARALLERREATLRGVAEARAAQVRHGWPYQLDAEKLDGSAAAYAIAANLLANLAGDPDPYTVAELDAMRQCVAMIDGTDMPCPWPVDRPQPRFGHDAMPTECAYHRAKGEPR